MWPRQLKMPSLVRCVIVLIKQALFIVHWAKLRFDADAIQGNLEALIADLKKAKPTAAKGTYIKKITLSSTMGPGLNLRSDRAGWLRKQTHFGLPLGRQPSKTAGAERLNLSCVDGNSGSCMGDRSRTKGYPSGYV